MKNILFALTILFFAACSSEQFIPTQADAERGASRYNGMTLEELSAGKVLYETKCTKCHPKKRPASHTAEEWSSIVPEMTEKSNDKGKPISKEESERILRYVTVLSGRP